MRLHASEHVRGLDLQALTLVFAAANGVATCTGFRAMMDGQGLLSPLLVTVAVQGLILVAVHRLVRAGGVAGRPIWFAEHFDARSREVAALVAATRAAAVAFDPKARAAGEAALDKALATAKALTADPRLAAWRDVARARLDAPAGLVARDARWAKLKRRAAVGLRLAYARGAELDAATVNPEQRRPDGSRSLRPWDRQLGSVAEGVAALALGAHDAPTVGSCDRSVPGEQVRNADGGAGHRTCADRRAWRPLRTVFGKSLNLPLLGRLAQLPPGQLEVVAGEAGLRRDPGSPPATALVLGLASAAPADLAAVMQAIARGAAGQRPIAARPRLVTAVHRLRPDGTTETNTVWRVEDRDLTRRLATRSAPAFLRAALGAPLRAGGTLLALGSALPSGDLHLAKTGTRTRDGRILERWLVGAGIRNGTAVSWVVYVATPDPRRPLGRRIAGNNLASLARLPVAGE